MNFKPELLAKVLSGEKTQTRRIARDNDYTWMCGMVKRYGRREVPSYSEICHANNRPRFVRGKDYAACPGRGKPQQGRIRILTLWREMASEISEDDARAEGFASRDEFLAKWDEINGKGKRDAYVWVIEFELVKEQERLLA